MYVYMAGQARHFYLDKYRFYPILLKYGKEIYGRVL